jgi:uncharacterized membrane protein
VAEHAPGSSPPAHWLNDWVNLRAIQALTHHTSAVVVAVVLFWLVGFVVQRLMPEGPFRRSVLLVDEFVLLCLFVYFAYQLLIFVR